MSAQAVENWVVLRREVDTYRFVGRTKEPVTREEALLLVGRERYENGKPERVTYIAIPETWWVGFEVLIAHAAEIVAEVGLG